MRHPHWRQAALCTALLAGCSSPPDRAEIFIETTPPGAACTLTRLRQPIATAGPTPAIALVEPGDAEITIRCRRPGFAEATGMLTAAKPQTGFGWVFGRPADAYQHRVDIVLTARRP